MLALTGLQTLLGAILAGVALEALVLVTLRARWRVGPPARQVLPNLGAGAFLLLAALGAVSGFGWLAVAACLAGAGACHGLDLWARWRV